MAELGDAYKAARERITELVRDRSPEELARVVPACPNWTVHNTVSHVAGVASDILAGNIDGVATDPWTAAQVEARRDRSTEEVLAEWAEKGPQVDPMVAFFPGRIGSQLVLDTTTHEHDVRQALGAPGAKDSEGVEIAVCMIVEVGMAAGIAKRGLPPLEVIAGDRRWVLGTGEPPADGDVEAAVAEEAARVLYGGDPVDTDGVQPAGSLKVEPFELLRAMTGRRSVAQIKALGWTVDPEPYLPLFNFGPFTTRADDLVE